MGLTQKLYCYIDESGQDTLGELFIVSAVVTGAEREALAQLLEQIERASGKGILKWTKSKSANRLAYIRTVFQNPVFQGKLHYAIYTNTLEYAECSITTAAEAILYHVEDDKYRADVVVDGLSKAERNGYAAGLRDLGVRTHKVRGLEDEQNAFIRLADAVCGFLRDADERPDLSRVKNAAIQEGYLIQLGEQ